MTPRCLARWMEFSTAGPRGWAGRMTPRCTTRWVEFSAAGPRGWAGRMTPRCTTRWVEFSAAGPGGWAGRTLPQRWNTFAVARAEDGGVRRQYSDFSIDKILDLTQRDHDSDVRHRQSTSLLMPDFHETPSFPGIQFRLKLTDVVSRPKSVDLYSALL